MGRFSLLPGPLQPHQGNCRQARHQQTSSPPFIGEIINYPGKSPLKLKRLQKGPFCGGDHPGRKWPVSVKSTQRQNWFHPTKLWSNAQKPISLQHTVLSSSSNSYQHHSVTLILEKSIDHVLEYSKRKCSPNPKEQECAFQWLDLPLQTDLFHLSIIFRSQTHVLKVTTLFYCGLCRQAGRWSTNRSYIAVASLDNLTNLTIFQLLQTKSIQQRTSTV